MNITIIFLPVYSPDLNPIEFIWKSIKKYISSIVLRCKDELKEVVEKLFYNLASSPSFARNWIKKFLATN
ncbi:MAG: transposase [Thermoplasmata archaeon]|nr:transposase [Thermoplasmata archaeon]